MKATLLKKFKSSLSSISYHRYPLTHCSGHIPTLPQLLTDSSSVQQAQTMKPYADETNAAGLPFYIGEGNSVSCGGMPGVSNTFAATLWSVDFLFNLASIGVKGMNFHGGSGAAYTAINYKAQSDTVPDVRPLYYGLWFFSQIARNQPKIIVPTVTSSNALIKVWPVVDKKGTTSVVVIHKDLKSTGPASVSVKPTTRLNSSAQLYVLQSRDGVNATYGISFAGQTFDGSTDGSPVGQQISTKITPDAAGTYQFKVDVLSIALLVLPSN